MDSGAWNLKHRFFIPSKKVVPYLIINNLLKRALPRREKIIRSGVVISLNFLNHACMQLAGFVIKSMKLNSQISFETTSLGKAGKNEHTGCWGGGAPEWTIATLCSCWEKEKLYYPVYSNSIWLLSTQKVGNPNAIPHHYSDKPFLLQEEFEVFLPRRYIFITLAA